jgi:FecR-like protein
MTARSIAALLTVLASVLLGVGSNAHAQDAWRISKSSGDVSIMTEGFQPIALTAGMSLQPGSSIRTGQNGRVLLMRGNETILVSANSAISFPKSSMPNGMSTIILQQAGSILLEVEKRAVNHFEVETPHLSAVVKGTRFQVTMSGNDTRVGVFRGQVEVTEFKSGQHALINAGQNASVSVQGSAGLSLGGTGPLSPIEQGSPRESVTPSDSTPDDNMSAPSPSAPIQRQARAPMVGEFETVALPEQDATRREGWGPGLTALSERTPAGKSEIDALSLAFPFAIGTLVALSIAVRRRRQQQKVDQG